MALVLLIGGARSGKSALAERLVGEQDSPVTFLATGQAGDREMAERIARHRSDRPSGWKTIEEPLRLREAIEAVEGEHCLIIDCLTLWTAHALGQIPEAEVEAEAQAAAAAAAARAGLTIAVSNEVGLGLVPASPLGRSYRDLLGRVNAAWARAAEQALFVVAGQMLRLEGTDGLGRSLR
jgi:adenosylcobinamide kinase/adenosylcobinamide-phosphate guanylyltransferase